MFAANVVLDSLFLVQIFLRSSEANADKLKAIQEEVDNHVKKMVSKEAERMFTKRKQLRLLSQKLNRADSNQQTLIQSLTFGWLVRLSLLARSATLCNARVRRTPTLNALVH